MPAKKKDKFERVLSSIADAVITVDSHGRVEWLNDAAEHALGVSLKIVAGAAVSEIFLPDSAIIASLGQVMASGVSFTDHDTEVVTPRGVRIPAGVSIHPLGGDGGGGAVIIMRDLAILKAMERYMGQSERMGQMAALAAGIAHEIKNPLGGIRGAAQLVKKETRGGEAEEFADLIISEVDRIDRLVLDLIDLNRPSVILKEPNNIYPILDDAVMLLKNAIAVKKLAVTRDFDPSLPSVLGDRDRLRQIFLNLVKNAVEAAGEGGSVTLRTSLAWRAPLSARKGKERRFVLIEVMDDGPGMDDEALSKVFTPFFSKKPGGSGLGLAMTLHLVQAHNGALEIKNRPDRPGLIASVYLPYSVEE